MKVWVISFTDGYSPSAIMAVTSTEESANAYRDTLDHNRKADCDVEEFELDALPED